jgi:hypothetical protein
MFDPSSENKQNAKNDRREGMNAVFVLARAYAGAITPFLRTGAGTESPGLAGVLTFCGLLLLAGTTKSQAMWVFFCVWLFALMCSRARTVKMIRQGAVIHSQYAGWPVVAATLFRVRKENAAKALEIPLVMAVGVLTACTLSELVGGFVFSTAFALALVRAIEYQVNWKNFQRQQDAMIQHRVMQEYWRHGRDDF